ncbi:4-hydroxyproline epimerase [Brucella abortus]|uniref:4-hydroxyproline epimerase n=1 Tax=Brucella abortus TaxID=235 RepID=UPI0002CD7D3D|nr:4-hydroxyproline epimerase [Brucella abortus]ENS32577.1 4-hydroxyproline epimerase [Brucella abortus F6/05-9]
MARHSFFCVDGHTCGNPVRLVAGGGPNLNGSTMMEKRAHFLAEYDWIRTGLMFEPRGHDMMSGSILYPPTRPDCDVAVLFIETSGCLPMCGHGTIGTVTMAIEQGLVTPKTPGKLNLDTPAGLVAIEYEQDGQYVERVRLTNVPAFLYAEGLEVECPDLGPIKVDVAYGGNFYAIVEPQENYTDMDDYSALQLIAWSPVLRQRLNEKYKFQYPELPDINRLSHILWTGKPKHPQAHARNAVFYGDKAIDRSPCGTGTSARMAQLAAKGKLKPCDEFIHESIIGSLFHGRVERAAEVAGRPAIVPSIAGWARMTGYNTIFIDDRDPFAHGFSMA